VPLASKMEPLVLAPAPTEPGLPVASPVVILPMPAKPERPSLAALFEAEESGLLRFALALVRRRSVAEDLVQETFLRLHQVWEEVENPRAWLYRSLRNLALNHLRDHPGEAELQEETLAAGDGVLPADTLERDEAIGMMRLLLAELPAEDRDLLELKYRDNLKYQEISRRTGLSVGNVGYRLHHVLKNLADGLRRVGIDAAEERRTLP
jgi:RNA polymerase sigma factor (sigma-70 family)